MSSENPDENRLSEFKFKGKDSKVQRGKRREYAVSLRKDRRREKFNKTRDITEEELQQELSLSEQIRRLCPTVFDDGNPEQFTALQNLRRLLANGTELPIQAAIQAGVLPQMVRMLQFPNEDFQYEAAWVLTNIASGTPEQTAEVVQGGALPHLVELLRKETPRLVDQSAWCLGNILGDGAHFRNLLHDLGALDPLLYHLANRQELRIVRNLSWAISNFFRWRNPPPPLAAMQKALPVLHKRITSQDEEVASNSLWALCYIAESTDEVLPVIIEKFGRELIQMLGMDHHDGIVPSIRIFGTLTAGDSPISKTIISLGFLDNVIPCLHHSKPNVRKDACWSISNICADTIEETRAVIEKNLVPTVARLAVTDPALKVRVDACWALSNIVAQGDVQHIQYVVAQGGLVAMVGCLSPEVDARGLIVFCEAIFHCLAQFSHDAQVMSIFEQFQGIDRLITLLDHQKEEVAAAAGLILDRFFNEEQQDIPDLAPAQQNGQYAFGVNPSQGENPNPPSGDGTSFQF